MRRDEMADLTAFVAAAEERSFTKAAAKLGMSQSALSQIVRRLEERLGLRLLARTTRSVAPTEAGERLLLKLSPMLRELDESLAELGELRERPAGTVRITTVEHAAKTVLTPALARLLPDYPEVTVELSIDYGLADIVADRFDAGVRIGEQVEKDMIAVRISPDFAMATVAAPAYLEKHPAPEHPRNLLEHRCINLRLPTPGTNYAWRFLEAGQPLQVRVTGPLVLNTIDHILDAALHGLGIAQLPLDMVEAHLADGTLVRILEESTATLPGYHLYYPNRRHPSPAFRLLVEAIRYHN